MPEKTKSVTYEYGSNDGKPIMIIRGYTTPIKDLLMSGGAVWNGPKLRWEVPGRTLPKSIADAIKGTASLDTAVAPVKTAEIMARFGVFSPGDEIYIGEGKHPDHGTISSFVSMNTHAVVDIAGGFRTRIVPIDDLHHDRKPEDMEAAKADLAETTPEQPFKLGDSVHHKLLDTTGGVVGFPSDGNVTVIVDGAVCLYRIIDVELVEAPAAEPAAVTEAPFKAGDDVLYDTGVWIGIAKLPPVEAKVVGVTAKRVKVSFYSKHHQGEITRAVAPEKLTRVTNRPEIPDSSTPEQAESVSAPTSTKPDMKAIVDKNIREMLAEKLEADGSQMEYTIEARYGVQQGQDWMGWVVCHQCGQYQDNRANQRAGNPDGRVHIHQPGFGVICDDCLEELTWLQAHPEQRTQPPAFKKPEPAKPTITLKTKHGDVTIEAEICDQLAIHRFLLRDNTPSASLWTLTHVKSGMIVFKSHKLKRELGDLADRLSGIDIDTYYANGAKDPEVAGAVHNIVREWVKQYRDGRYD